MGSHQKEIEEQKKAFVEPTVTEEASLTNVTLQTGVLPELPDVLLIEEELGGMV